jgi:hypothetical protein
VPQSTEWLPAGFAGEKVAEPGLIEAEVVPEGELSVGRDEVCARGLVCAHVVLRVPSESVRRRAHV